MFDKEIKYKPKADNWIEKKKKIQQTTLVADRHGAIAISNLARIKELDQFKNLKKIDCIGFGDFDVNRGWGSQGTDGYEDFKETFDIVAPYFKNFFEKNNIEINFLGDSNNNYYFKKLRSF